MNRERAEAHLRLLAEEDLRRATPLVPDGTAGSPPEEAMRGTSVIRTLAGSAAVPDAVRASRGARGTDRADTKLYSVHYRTLVRLAVFLVRDTRAAEQVVQDAFVALRHGGPQPGDTGAALAYLRQAVVNRSRLVLRHRSVPGLRPTRVARAARVLTAVGALDDQVAGQILEDFELALAARWAAAPGEVPGSWLRSGAARPRSAMTVRAGRVPAGPRAGPGRVVRLGQLIPVRGADVSGEVYLLSYARTGSGPQVSLHARTRRRAGPAPARRWPEIPLLEQFTAADDRGTRYRMRVRDLGGGPDGWTLMLDPDPPHDPRWLDLTTTPGEPAVRIDLNPSVRPPDTATVTASAATASPGEHLLHAAAARLLAAAAVPAGTGPGPAAPRPGPLSAAAGLGDVIAALQAAGALSPLSLVPGQLAALCARLNAGDHGITAPPARDLPAPWLSMLAHDHGRTDPARDGCAAAAAVLPGLDGITLAILGLHTGQGSTVMHAHASGPMCRYVSDHPDDPVSDQPDELYYGPVIWIRDSGGRWHTTRIRGHSGINDQVALRLEVIPPLSRATAWIEVLAAGHSAQARAVLPLRWQ